MQCNPYVFEGDAWTPEAQEIVRQAIALHVPETVDPMFSEWHFFANIVYGGETFYLMKRATWDTSWGAYSAEEVAIKITKYYTKE
jgi:hypothetical protein